MLAKRVLTGFIVAVTLIGCSAGATTRVLPELTRSTQCNNMLGAERSVQGMRSTRACLFVPFNTGDSLFTDVQSFQEIVDATMDANPCMASIARCGDAQLSLNDTIYANPGGPATRGDNCTPVPGYAIGYSLGGGTPLHTVIAAPNSPISGDNTMTIVNQSTIYGVNSLGVQTQIGWLLYTAGGATYFVPDLTVAFGIAVVSGTAPMPSAFPISINAKTANHGTNAVRGVISQVSNSLQAPILPAFAALLQNTSKLYNTPCNTAPIQTT